MIHMRIGRNKSADHALANPLPIELTCAVFSVCDRLLHKLQMMLKHHLQLMKEP